MVPNIGRDVVRCFLNATCIAVIAAGSDDSIERIIVWLFFVPRDAAEQKVQSGNAHMSNGPTVEVRGLGGGDVLISWSSSVGVEPTRTQA